MRRNVIRVGRSLCLVVVSVLLAAGGAALMLWALYRSLAGMLGITPAAFFTGLVALLLAGVFIWLAEQINR